MIGCTAVETARGGFVEKESPQPIDFYIFIPRVKLCVVSFDVYERDVTENYTLLSETFFYSNIGELMRRTFLATTNLVQRQKSDTMSMQ